MAKRKRLSPARGGYLTASPVDAPSHPAGTGPPIANVAGDAATAASAVEMAEILRTARDGGRMVLELPLDSVQADYLMRDRLAADSEEMETLKNSLLLRGQQTPIDVCALAEGRYGLISGWRRLNALKALQAEGKGGGVVLALVRRPESAPDAYLAMIEENEIRVGLSYYERARITVRAVEQKVFETDKQALLHLYRSASRAKRSKIGSFLGVVRELEDVLRFPESMGERLGLRLAKWLEADTANPPALRACLTAADVTDAAVEQTLIDKTIAQVKPKTAAVMPESRAVAPGIRLTERGAQSLQLSGAGVTPDLIKALEDWLKARAS